MFSCPGPFQAMRLGPGLVVLARHLRPASSVKFKSERKRTYATWVWLPGERANAVAKLYAISRHQAGISCTDKLAAPYCYITRYIPLWPLCVCVCVYVGATAAMQHYCGHPCQIVAVVRRGEHKEAPALEPCVRFAEGHSDALLNALRAHRKGKGTEDTPRSNPKEEKE